MSKNIMISIKQGKNQIFALCVVMMALLLCLVMLPYTTLAATEDYTVTYHSMDGEFYNGDTENTVVYHVTKNTEIKAYSYTKNLSSNGKQNSNYGNYWDEDEIRGTGRTANSRNGHVVTIPGAEELQVTITYGGDSSDYMCMWKGAYADKRASYDYTSSVTGKLGGGSHTNANNTKTFTVQGDTVTFGFYSNGSNYGDGYGYYAVIKGIGTKIEKDGIYREPIPNNGDEIFAIWNSEQNGSGIFKDSSDISVKELPDTLPASLDLYAIYDDANAERAGGWWRIVPADSERERDYKLIIGMNNQSEITMPVAPYLDDIGRKVVDWPWERFTSSEDDGDHIIEAEIIGTVHAGKTLRDMFEDQYYLQNIIGLPNLKTDNATDMSNMFSYCRSIKDLDLSTFNTSNVTNINSIFYGCYKLERLNLSGWVTGMNVSKDSMFSYCDSLNSIILSSGFSFQNQSTYSYVYLPQKTNEYLDGKWTKADGTTQKYSPYELSRQWPANSDAWAGEWIPAGDPWWTFEDGTLTIGTGGYMVIPVSTEECYYPIDRERAWGWNSKRDEIKKIVFNGNVKGSGYMSRMFAGCYSLESVDITGLDTSETYDLSCMFKGCGPIKSLDLSSLDVSNANNLSEIFAVNTISSLDISTWEIQDGCYTYGMFGEDKNLAKISIGPGFVIEEDDFGDIVFPTVSTEPPYTGKWQREDGTAGPFTINELKDIYNSDPYRYAGTWVWEGYQPEGYRIAFEASVPVSTQMPDASCDPASKYIIPDCTMESFGKVFRYWILKESDPEVQYRPGDFIPENTYTDNDEIILIAFFVDKTGDMEIKNGEVEFNLMAGDTIRFDNIPASTAYQVWEETPDGWELVAYNNTSGYIKPLETIDSDFLNKYTPGTTSAMFTGNKIFNNSAPEADSFEFILLNQEDGSELQRVTNKDGGLIQFDTVMYDAVGEYKYIIKENPEYIGGPVSDKGYTAEDIQWDQHVERIKVVVTADDSNNLHADVRYDIDGVGFTNTLKPGVLRIIKEVLGKTNANQDQEFEFDVMLQNPDGTLNSGDGYGWSTRPSN